jgi:hypothetical protein
MTSESMFAMGPTQYPPKPNVNREDAGCQLVTSRPACKERDRSPGSTAIQLLVVRVTNLKSGTNR